MLKCLLQIEPKEVLSYIIQAVKYDEYLKQVLARNNFEHAWRNVQTLCKLANEAKGTLAEFLNDIVLRADDICCTQIITSESSGNKEVRKKKQKQNRQL